MHINTEIKFEPDILRGIYQNLLEQNRKSFRNNELRRVFIILISGIVFIMPFVINYLHSHIQFSIVALFLLIFFTEKTIRDRIKYNSFEKKLVNEITNWINQKSKVANYRITTDEEKLVLYEDEVPTEFKWDKIIEKNINEEFIWIRTNDNETLILPNTLLTTTNRLLLKSLIENKSIEK